MLGYISQVGAAVYDDSEQEILFNYVKRHALSKLALTTADIYSAYTL